MFLIHKSASPVMRNAQLLKVSSRQNQNQVKGFHVTMAGVLIRAVSVKTLAGCNVRKDNRGSVKGTVLTTQVESFDQAV